MSTHESGPVAQVTAWRWSDTQVVLSYDLISPAVAGTKGRPRKVTRVLVDYSAELREGDLVVLCWRMAQWVLSAKGLAVRVPKGLRWHEVGGAAASVPPSGGEGGESSGTDELGTPPLPGLTEAATIFTPPTRVKQESAPRRSRGTAR